MKKLKTSAFFTLGLVPIAALCGYFSIRYQLDFMDAASVELAISQMGSVDMLIIVYVVQTVCYALFCGFFGCWLAQSLGLFHPLGLEKAPLLRTLILSVLFGILFSLDYWTFGAWIPGIQEAWLSSLHWDTVLASVLYGGIMEEIMLRLFTMSLIAWVLWKLFFRRHKTVPSGILIAANVLAAIIFAAGHLPATVMTFGTLTPMHLIRCFLLNGGFGLFFGWLYRKYGIQYAVIGHASLHIVSKLIWAVFT